jgi:hypothetical protein
MIRNATDIISGTSVTTWSNLGLLSTIAIEDVSIVTFAFFTTLLPGFNIAYKSFSVIVLSKTYHSVSMTSIVSKYCYYQPGRQSEMQLSSPVIVLHENAPSPGHFIIPFNLFGTATDTVRTAVAIQYKIDCN